MVYSTIVGQKEQSLQKMQRGYTMADIRSFLKEREKREQNRTDYKAKIRIHKLTTMYRVLLICIVLIAVVALLMVLYKRHVYTSYDVVASIERDKSSEAIDVALGNTIITYSKDGAHCTDAKGNIIWNQTYEIQDIKFAINQNVAAIGNYNGRDIYVQNTEGILGMINTTMPIQNIAVSANGYVTAILADTNVTMINTYDSSGELVADGEARMSRSGYPGAIALSPDGQMLAVAYVYVDAGTLKTNIAFYNFGRVGKNVGSDRVVSAYSYTDLLVPEICFLDGNTAFAVGDDSLLIYKGSQIPTLEARYMFDREILSVFSGEKYIGLVFRSDDSENRYQMNVYNTSAQMVDSYFFDIDYTDIIFTEDNFIIYNETQCVIRTYEGLEKFNGNFMEPVNLMIPTGSAYRYLLVTNDSIDTIQLK